ncbi:MAG: ATP synthase F1 subunit delta [Clostridium sp.]|nr:ATP synthase F1 subunit delta [Acetatifactor muris]MCM1525854.1 ATP synthase F1 subunit delta [Bacteroides sp.]MCM1562606.1 ATP synthase F1 subunit delta [Clostridium sp.]
MAKLVSKTYGEALFQTAMDAQPDVTAGGESGKVDELFAQVQQISDLLQENRDFDKMMLHPGIPKQEKVAAMEAVFKGRVSDELTGLMEIVIRKERYGDLQDIFSYFIDRVKEVKGIGVAYITSAKALTDGQKAATVARLLETTSYQSIESHFKVDETLIGGMVIRINDRVVDSSVRSKIDDLTRQLLQIRLG